MKKLFLLLMLIPVISFSQLDFEETTDPVKIGELKVAGVYYGSVHYNEEHDTYFIMYKNLKYSNITDIKSFVIKSTKDYEELYEIITNTLGEKKDLEINLGDHKKLKLAFNKKNVQFNVWNGTSWSYSLYMNQKQINRLFGKE
jgi:hypothetical protein